MSVIDLLQTKDLADFIEGLQPQPDGTYRMRCPFHSGATNPTSFTVFPSNTWYCFGCDTGGDIFRYVMERDCCTFAEAIETLCDFYNIDLQKDKVYVRQKSLAEQNEAVCRKYEKKLPVIHDYLVQKRGFSEEIIKLYRFGWSEKASALTIPLIDRYGRVSGFTYRFFDKEPKYKHTRNSELLEKRKFWFNLINARKLVKKRGRLWVVEGHLDAASGQQMGEAAIAYLGIVMSKEQLLDLKKTFEHLGSSIEIILVPDADGKAITHIPKVRNMFARWWPEANLRVALMEELNHE